MRIFARTLLLTGVIIWAAIPQHSAVSQPSLTFSRIVNNWPTIELYFKVACDGKPAFPRDKSKFHVTENGKEIPQFTLWVPDSVLHCAKSVGIVLDAGASMAGSNRNAAIFGTLRFLSKFQDSTNEAMIVYASTPPVVALSMTSDTTALQAAVNALPAKGHSSVWDGIYYALQELILSGSNPCRGIFVVTDGESMPVSTHTIGEIVALANRNRIRISIIGLPGANEQVLEALADSTSGKYYFGMSEEAVDEIFKSFDSVIMDGLWESLITYQAHCLDGAERNVELTLSDYCSGSDSASKSYRAPRDTTTFMPLEIALENDTVRAGDEAIIPLRMKTPIPAESVLFPATFSVLFDEDCLQFKELNTPQGTMLHSAMLDVSPISGGIRVSVQSSMLLQGDGVLAYLTFQCSSPDDTTACEIDLTSWSFQQGCFNAVLNDAYVLILPDPAPVIVVGGSLEFCEGDSVTLMASPGYTDYTWSNGRTGDAITVTQSGTYSVEAKHANGQRYQSVPVAVLVHPLPTVPTITQKGNTLTCSVTAIMYDWYLNGSYLPNETGRSIVITQSGVYTVRATDSNGCSAKSNPDVFTGIDRYQPFLARKFSISPNPTNGAFNVALEFERPTAFGMRVVNTLGQTVFEKYITDPVVEYNVSILLNNAPPGVYFFMLQSGGHYDYKNIILR